MGKTGSVGHGSKRRALFINVTLESVFLFSKAEVVFKRKEKKKSERLLDTRNI